ncbi:MAG: autorepressor SdpR family transcription factor [Lactobacillales bacterium]|jgi:DNA-binding transcriptional ArsR family regulator|nr:autorepressor SdpR family transcription factor [Lactobacillales bacterium]
MGINETLKALADPVRREILEQLKSGPKNAGEIGEHFELKGATISHHLSILKAAGLIDAQKKGTFITYYLNTSIFEEVVGWVAKLKGE